MKYLLVVLITLCSAVILGCSDDPNVDTEAARKNLADGWTAYNQGDFSAALPEFRAGD